MFTREKRECFNALEHYLKQQGIDLDSVPDDDIEMDESAIMYVLKYGADIGGVEIEIGDKSYFTPLLEYNSEIDGCLSELRIRGFKHETVTWKERKYHVLSGER